MSVELLSLVIAVCAVVITASVVAITVALWLLAGDARITEINESIGFMRRALRRWLVDQNGEAG